MQSRYITSSVLKYLAVYYWQFKNTSLKLSNYLYDGLERFFHFIPRQHRYWRISFPKCLNKNTTKYRQLILKKSCLLQSQRQTRIYKDCHSFRESMRSSYTTVLFIHFTSKRISCKSSRESVDEPCEPSIIPKYENYFIRDFFLCNSNDWGLWMKFYGRIILVIEYGFLLFDNKFSFRISVTKNNNAKIFCFHSLKYKVLFCFQTDWLFGFQFYLTEICNGIVN